MAAGEEYPPLYLQGIAHFNHLEFFEAHDAWEELWTDHTADDRTFYKGLIQMAVCLHHFSKGNTRGARKLYRTSRDYLAEYSPCYIGIDLVALLARFERCCAGLQIDPTDQPPSGEPHATMDARLSPRIELQPPAVAG